MNSASSLVPPEASVVHQRQAQIATGRKYRVVQTVYKATKPIGFGQKVSTGSTTYCKQIDGKIVKKVNRLGPSSALYSINDSLQVMHW